jgi:hypothetical protein
MARRAAMANYTFQIKVTIRGSSKTIRLKETEDCTIPMEITIRANGKMIKHMAMVSISLLLEGNIKEIGKKISVMGRGKKLGLMAPSFRVIMSSMRSQVMVNFSSKTEITIQE